MPTSREELMMQLEENEALIMPGYDECIVGITYGGCAVYDCDLVIAQLMTQDLSYEDAYDYLDFNMAQAYAGDMTPLFIWGVTL